MTCSDGGRLVGRIKDWEIWEVKTHAAARQLGRFYKGRSAAWSTSVDTDYFWNNNYANDDFWFLVREKPLGDDFDKLAFQFRANGLQVWDIRNRKGTFSDWEVIDYMQENFHWTDKRTDDLVYFNTPGIKIVDNGDGTVNIIGSLYLDGMGYDQLPWKRKYRIRELFGSLYINDNRLKSLEGCPETVHGDFIASGNLLENLAGAPRTVEGLAVYE